MDKLLRINGFWAGSAAEAGIGSVEGELEEGIGLADKSPVSGSYTRGGGVFVKIPLYFVLVSRGREPYCFGDVNILGLLNSGLSGAVQGRQGGMGTGHIEISWSASQGPNVRVRSLRAEMCVLLVDGVNCRMPCRIDPLF